MKVLPGDMQMVRKWGQMIFRPPFSYKQNKQNDPKFKKGFEKIFFYFKKIFLKKISALKMLVAHLPCFACNDFGVVGRRTSYVENM